jgi:hypothetical protein
MPGWQWSAAEPDSAKELALRNAELEPTAAAWSRNWRSWKRQ